MSILRDIYDGEYSPIENPVTMPPPLRHREQAFFDEVEKAMGRDFIEKHWKSICDAEDYENFNSFREGFRLGVALMLEVL